ncbi:MAG: response regulator [Planctomycetes bacterium]|jgi:DNA-binding response OmpR family regulator|nr:response regulator [Planctomycetota bacterium]
MEKRVFIIEDDLNILYGLQNQFSSEGFEAETSTGEEDVEEIINKIKDFQADIVVLDLILPKVDGLEIIKGIKGDEEIGQTPIFIFTDLSDEDSRSRSLDMGANYYFLKDDIDIYAFVAKVKKIIGNKEGLEDNYEDDDEEEIDEEGDDEYADYKD